MTAEQHAATETTKSNSRAHHSQAHRPLEPRLDLLNLTRSRLLLAITLASFWCLLVANREWLEYADGVAMQERLVHPMDSFLNSTVNQAPSFNLHERLVQLFYSNQMALIRASLIAIAILATGGGGSLVLRTTLSGAALLLTILLARISFPVNMLETTQSIIIKAGVYWAVCAFAFRKSRNSDTKQSPQQLQLSIADILILVSLAATFLAAIQGNINRFADFATVDLFYLWRDGRWSCLYYLFESLVEASLALSCLWMRSRWTWPRQLLAVLALIIISSCLNTLAIRISSWASYGYAIDRWTLSGSFEVVLPILAAFLVWIYAIDLVGRFVGYTPRPSTHAERIAT